MMCKKNLREFSSFSWRKRRQRRDLLAFFNHLSSSCREGRGKIILNTTQKKAQEAMNIVCIMGNSYLIQSLSVRMIMAQEAASQGNTQHLLKGGSNCKTRLSLSKQVDHFTSKGLHPNSANVQCYEYLWTHLLCSYCSSWLAKNTATQRKLRVRHTDRSQQIHIILFIIFVDFWGCFLVDLFWVFLIKWFQDIRTCRFCTGTDDFSFYYYIYFSLTFISQIVSLFYSCFYSRTTLLT